MKQRVLFVDDEENILTGMKRSFRRNEFDVLVASGGTEALETLKSEPVDLIVTDQNMPHMSGIELLRQVREHYPDTIRFVLTGRATLDLALQAINEGEVARFFVKPCDMRALEIAIRQALQQKELMREARRLLAKVKEQQAVLDQVESRSPGLTRVHRDEQGVIELDELPEDYDAFLAQIRETLGNGQE